MRAHTYARHICFCANLGLFPDYDNYYYGKTLPKPESGKRF